MQIHTCTHGGQAAGLMNSNEKWLKVWEFVTDQVIMKKARREL
jgi:hypothetical protein